MQFKRRAETVLVAVFMTALILPMLRVNFAPGTVSEAEQRTLQAFPPLYNDDGSENQQFRKKLETWFNDNVGFRETLYMANAHMEYDLFNSSASERVAVGREGWLFYTARHNVDMAAGYFPGLTQEILEQICAEQQAVADKLAGQGIEYVLLLSPSKTSIYPEYLRGNFQVRSTPSDILADYLDENTDVKVVQMKPALLEEKERTGELLFYKTDTHWNKRGAYVGYRETIRRLREWGLLDGEAVKVEFEETDALRTDLARIVAGPSEQYFEPEIGMKILNSATSSVMEGEIYDRLANYAKRNNISELYYVQNKEQMLPRFLLLKDSFGSNLIWPLAEHSSELVSVDSREITQELLDIVKPEIVFIEVTERYIPELKGVSSGLSRMPATVNVQEDVVDIFYQDEGLYEKMWFPVWSDENGQDDARWYEAARVDEMTWYQSGFEEPPLEGHLLGSLLLG